MRVNKPRSCTDTDKHFAPVSGITGSSISEVEELSQAIDRIVDQSGLSQWSSQLMEPWPDFTSYGEELLINMKKNDEVGNKKNIYFFFLMFVMTIVVIESMGQLAYRIEYGYWIFQGMERATEKFNIRDFNDRVDDKRTFTLKTNFKNDHYGKSEKSKGFRLYIDEYGFRSGTHTTNRDCVNIVFLGDSVPFGWGLGDFATLPSKFFDRLDSNKDSRCVINAAAPSYSLFQAIARYEREIYKEIAVDTIYLQIYDPASQVVLLGKDWHPEQNWAMGRQRYNTKSDIFFGKYGSILFFIFDRLLREGILQADSPIKRLETTDDKTIARFRKVIREALNRFLILATESRVKKVIVAPVTVPKTSFENLSDIRKMMINIQNEEFQRFSDENNSVVFFDTKKLLASYKEADVFIDQCCHLSEEGSEIVAESLFDFISQH